MILSQFKLNLDHHQARLDLSNPYNLHRTVTTRLLTGERGLWRLDEENNQVLLLSESEPHWNELQNNYLSGSPSSKAYPIDEIKWQGRRFHFRLKANPTKSVKDGDTANSRGKRVQLVSEEQKLDWLSKQGARHGFRVLDATTSATRNLRFVKKRGQSKVTLGWSLFEGVLEVEDESLFRQSLREGIGRAKSFGFGLLSIAPG